MTGVPPLDEADYGRWLVAARDNLSAARYNADGEIYHVAVLLAEQAAQCALKALLHGVGANREARHHDLLALADAGADHAGLALTGNQREAVGNLAREYKPTRYPDALPGGTPRDYYGPSSAHEAMGVAEAVIAAVETCWSALTHAGADAEASREDPPA